MSLVSGHETVKICSSPSSLWVAGLMVSSINYINSIIIHHVVIDVQCTECDCFLKLLLTLAQNSCDIRTKLT